VTADAGSASAVSASHQMTDLPLDLRARRCVVRLPVRAALPLAGALELLLVLADVDRAAITRFGAPVGELA
jgi:hypothetical protein